MPRSTMTRCESRVAAARERVMAAAPGGPEWDAAMVALEAADRQLAEHRRWEKVNRIGINRSN